MLQDEYRVDQPELPDVPADEQRLYAHARSEAVLPRVLVLGGVALIVSAILSWKHMGDDFPFEGWTKYLPAITFVAAFGGVLLLFYGVYLKLLEPDDEPVDRFAAWGRFFLGLGFTVVGLLGKHNLLHQKSVPPEAAALAIMCLIAGPVLCGWACYGTFVKDRSSRDTGILLMAAMASFLAIALWG
jgi:hypothetical protein